MSFKYFIILFNTCVILSACTPKAEDIKSFSHLEPIDSIIINSNIKPSFYNTYTNINYPYFTTLNEDGNILIVFNLETFELNTIKLFDFLNQHSIVQINNYCFINHDSILINGFNSKLLYLIDSNAILKRKINTLKLFNNDTNLKFINSYSNPIHYSNNKLYLAYQNTSYNNYFTDSIHREKFFTESVAYKFDIDSSAKLLKFAVYPDYFRVSNSYYDWYINSCKNTNSIDYVFSNIDTIYSFNISSNIAQTFPVDNRYHKPNNYFNHSTPYNYNDIRKYYVENSFYNRIYFDHIRNQYLLYYSRGVEFEKNKFENNLYSDKYKLLILKDTKSGKNQYLQIDKEFIPESLAFNSKGILIAKKRNQDIIYYVYKI